VIPREGVESFIKKVLSREKKRVIPREGVERMLIRGKRSRFL